MAGYETALNNAWLSLQVFPSSRVEVFATSAYNSGHASIKDFGYDAGALTGVLFGLDYPLQSASMAGFSNLKIARFTQTVGLNYRMNDRFVLNGLLSYDNNQDDEPWLYDSTGKYVNVFAGISYVF
jgi:hypothetical protein